MRWPVFLLIPSFFCFVNPGYCYEPTPLEMVERHIISFSPPVLLTSDTPPCMGLVKSPERIVMLEECVSAARKAMMEGAVTVNNINGERVGSLPYLSGNPVLQVQPGVLPLMELPFVLERQEVMDEGSYPRFES